MTGKDLKAARLKSGLSRQQLARIVAVGPESVWRWEQGKRHISDMTAELLRRVLAENNPNNSARLG